MAETSKAVKNLVTAITKGDDAKRGAAWQAAHEVGPAAIPALAEVMDHDDFEVARSARRAIWKIVRHAGRPDACDEKTAAVAAILPLIAAGQSRRTRAEALWMLSEIAGDEAVEPIAALLDDAEIREDARCALQRLPGSAAVSALMRAALGEEEIAFKTALVASLRARGVEVAGVPCQKLVPTRETSVKPAGS